MVVTAFIWLLPQGVAAQDSGVLAAPRVTVDQVTLAHANSARAQIAVQGDRLLFERVDFDGFSRVWTSRLDGTFERCLTCDNPDFRQSHTGVARWHPSGNLIAFLVERPLQKNKRRGTDRVSKPTPFIAIPGRNRSSDIWLASADGKRFWNLTNSANRGGNPVYTFAFSHEGNVLAWSEREASASGSLWGAWVLQVGSFRIARATPKLSKVVSHRPTGPGFVSVNEFAADDLAIDVAATPRELPSTVEGQDLFRYHLTNRRVEPWTETPTAWDDYLTFSPVDDLAVFSSSGGFPPAAPLQRQTPSFLPITELWIANEKGDLLTALTGFNDPLSPYYLGEPAHVGPATWTADGRALLVTVTPISDPFSPALFRVEISVSG